MGGRTTVIKEFNNAKRISKIFEEVSLLKNEAHNLRGRKDNFKI